MSEDRSSRNAALPHPFAVLLVATSSVLFVAPLAMLLWPAARILAELGCLIQACGPIERWDTRAAANVVMFLGMCLWMVVRGIAVYWRTGRRRPLAGPLVSSLALGSLSSLWLGPVATAGPVLRGGWGLTVGLVPLLLLGLPSARRWTAEMTEGDGPHRLFWGGRNLRGWDDRLSEPTLDHLERARMWLVVALCTLPLLVTLIPMFSENGTVAGLVELGIIAAIVTGALVLRYRAVSRARNQVAREHRLPPESCTGVLFDDPTIYDFTLVGAMKRANRSAGAGQGQVPRPGPNPAPPAVSDRSS